MNVVFNNKNTYIIVYVGAYVPLIKEGKIMVDGVLASCYASVDHELAHVGMMPLQWFPKIVRWIFGGDDGFSTFAKMGKLGLPHELLW